jgi:acetoin utilization protein AcuB
MIDDPYQVAPETPINEVANTMAKERLGSAVVVKNGRVVGIFTTVDACRCLAEVLETRQHKA